MVNFPTDFLAACNNLNQTIKFCGVGAHHQNGIVENRNKQPTQPARVLLLHGMRMWPQMVDQMFWPFAIKAAAERMNSLHIDTYGYTPESKFYCVNIINLPVKTFHAMFYPCYVLDSRLHKAGLNWTAKMGTEIKHLCISWTLFVSRRTCCTCLRPIH
jgi:hypothetical protein